MLMLRNIAEVVARRPSRRRGDQGLKEWGWFSHGIVESSSAHRPGRPSFMTVVSAVSSVAAAVRRGPLRRHAFWRKHGKVFLSSHRSPVHGRRIPWSLPTRPKPPSPDLLIAMFLLMSGIFRIRRAHRASSALGLGPAQRVIRRLGVLIWRQWPLSACGSSAVHSAST